MVLKLLYIQIVIDGSLMLMYNNFSPQNIFMETSSWHRRTIVFKLMYHRTYFRGTLGKYTETDTLCAWKGLVFSDNIRLYGPIWPM